MARLLERTAGELRKLAGELGAGSTRPKLPAPAAEQVEELKALGRDAAAQRISNLSHHGLGELFVLTGGPARDKKRSKDWLAERILWNLFDFDAGHDIIKG